MSFNDIHRSRELFFQSLYQMHMTGSEKLANLVDDFSAENNAKKFDEVYLADLVENYNIFAPQVEMILSDLIKNSSNKVNPVELCVCKLAIYELMLKQDIPYKVIISEALKIQQKFGEEEGFRIVNGVLDKASKIIKDA